MIAIFWVIYFARVDRQPFLLPQPSHFRARITRFHSEQKFCCRKCHPCDVFCPPFTRTARGAAILARAGRAWVDALLPKFTDSLSRYLLSSNKSSPGFDGVSISTPFRAGVGHSSTDDSCVYFHLTEHEIHDPGPSRHHIHSCGINHRSRSSFDTGTSCKGLAPVPYFKPPTRLVPSIIADTDHWLSSFVLHM